MRMNISVPDDLAEQVRALDLPISAVCQQALSTAVREAKFTGALDKVADRLRSTIDAQDVRRRKEGLDDGIEWARMYATADELSQLANGDSDALHSTSETLVAFKSAQLGQDVISVDVRAEEDWPYWESFMLGAARVWDAVHDRI